MTARFLKHSIWSLSEPLYFRARPSIALGSVSIVVPAGTHFKIPYTRLRDSHFIPVTFLNFPAIGQVKKDFTRFPNAHAMLTEKQLIGAELISIDDKFVCEYFIRDKNTLRMLSGNQDTPVAFRVCNLDEANHYVSRENALVGVTSYMHRLNMRKNIPKEPEWEIVAHDPITNLTKEVIAICPHWYANISFLATHDFPPHLARNMRSFANTLPMDSRRLVSVGAFNTDSSTGDYIYLKEHFDIIHRNDIFGFYSKSDSVLAKIYLGDRINMWEAS